MFTKTKHSPLFAQKGLVIGDHAAHAVIANAGPSIYRLSDMVKKSKTLDAVIAELRSRDFHIEFPMDAGHGRRYCMVVFQKSGDRNGEVAMRENQGARKMAFDFMCAPSNSFFTSPAF